MKNLMIILFAVLTFSSCVDKEASKTPPAVNSIQVVEAKVDFSNPGFIAGSSFGDLFISMIRTQNYDMALKFTSKESIEKFGADKIIEKYKTFTFNYKLTQKSITKDGSKFIIAYYTNEYATGKIKKMVVNIENDSCKLVLPDNIEELLK